MSRRITVLAGDDTDEMFTLASRTLGLSKSRFLVEAGIIRCGFVFAHTPAARLQALEEERDRILERLAVIERQLGIRPPD